MDVGVLAQRKVELWNVVVRSISANPSHLLIESVSLVLDRPDK